MSNQICSEHDTRDRLAKAHAEPYVVPHNHHVHVAFECGWDAARSQPGEITLTRETFGDAFRRAYKKQGDLPSCSEIEVELFGPLPEGKDLGNG